MQKSKEPKKASTEVVLNERRKKKRCGRNDRNLLRATRTQVAPRRWSRHTRSILGGAAGCQAVARRRRRKISGRLGATNWHRPATAGECADGVCSDGGVFSRFGFRQGVSAVSLFQPATRPGSAEATLAVGAFVRRQNQQDRRRLRTKYMFTSTQNLKSFKSSCYIKFLDACMKYNINKIKTNCTI